MSSLSFTDDRCADQIHERNRFPYQICVGNSRGHPIICVPQLPDIARGSELMIFIDCHSIDNNKMYVLICYSLNCLFNGCKIIITLFSSITLLYSTILINKKKA